MVSPGIRAMVQAFCAEAVVDVAEEIRGSDGGFFLEQLDFDVAESGFKNEHGGGFLR